MNNYAIRPVGSGLNILKTGGTPTLIQRISGFMNWKIISIIIIGLLLVIFAYYTYKQYTDGKTTFYANRENIPKAQNKTATLMLFYVDIYRQSFTLPATTVSKSDASV